MTTTARVGPLGALGAVAGAVGTLAMDLVWFQRYRKGGGQQRVVAWETAEGVHTREEAPAPGQVGQRLVLALTHRKLPDRWARTMTNVMHWATGMAWGAAFGIIAGSTKRRSAVFGLLLGPVAWLASYAVLPLAKLYKPIWEYDARTLAKDLSAHMVYGATTGAAFAALTRYAGRGSTCEAALAEGRSSVRASSVWLSWPAGR